MKQSAISATIAAMIAVQVSTLTRRMVSRPAARHAANALLRNPESIGNWLPRLIEGWHKGWRDAGIARWQHEFVDAQAAILKQITVKQTQALEELSLAPKPTQVIIRGEIEAPDDIAEALGDD
jgi:hypothetical protein